MSVISGSTSTLWQAAQALNVFSVDVQIAAHNIANVSTTDFKPQRAHLATGSNGNGVVLQNVLPQPDRGNFSSISNKENSIPADMANKSGGTELATEFTHLIADQHAFAANAKVIGAEEEMMTALLNLHI